MSTTQTQTQTFNNGEWTPTKRAPLNGKAGASAGKEKTATPITLTVDIAGEVSDTLKAIVEGQATLAAGIDAVNAALKANAAAMETWLKRLDRVMSAPRSVTLKRGEDGLAKSAISEALVPKAKG